YWHSVMGDEAHVLHGGIYNKYIELGGYGVAPIQGKRLFGFPLTDEVESGDGMCPLCKFEWGSIYWSFSGVAIYGKFYEEFNKIGRETGRLGYPIADPLTISDGEIVFFELGCMYCGQRSNNEVIEINYKFPQLGHPWMINQSQISTMDV